MGGMASEAPGDAPLPVLGAAALNGPPRDKGSTGRVHLGFLARLQAADLAATVSARYIAE